jgi:rhodanese-related sulfurtransferase
MQQLDVTQLRAQLAAWQAEGLRPVVLDVREPWEVALAALRPGTGEGEVDAECLHIPMQQLPQRLAELDPARPHAVLCHHGMRSLQVALFLSDRGMPRVCNIAGGIDAWSRRVDPRVACY